MRAISLAEAIKIIEGTFASARKRKAYPLSAIVLDAGGRVKAFHKQDGSNLRFLWQEAKGWFRFGTRSTWLKKKHPIFGVAMELFQAMFATELPATLNRHKEYSGARNLVAFCEFFGSGRAAFDVHRLERPADDAGVLERSFIDRKSSFVVQ